MSQQPRYKARFQRLSVESDCRECPYCGADGLYAARGHWRAPRLRCGKCWRDCIPSGFLPEPTRARVVLDGASAMAFIQKIVPRFLPGVRDDVVQEMLLLMLSGQISHATAKQRLESVVQDVRRTNGHTIGPWLVRPDQTDGGWEAIENEMTH